MNEYYTVLNLVGTGFIYWAALVGVASVAVHLTVFDRHSVMSVHLLGYMTAMAAVLVLSAVRNLTGDSWWFQLLRLAVFGLVPIFMTQRLILQLRARRMSKPQPVPVNEESSDEPA